MSGRHPAQGASIGCRRKSPSPRAGPSLGCPTWRPFCAAIACFSHLLLQLRVDGRWKSKVFRSVKKMGIKDKKVDLLFANQLKKRHHFYFKARMENLTKHYQPFYHLTQICQDFLPSSLPPPGTPLLRRPQRSPPVRPSHRRRPAGRGSSHPFPCGSRGHPFPRPEGGRAVVASPFSPPLPANL